jgi:dTDP-4-dehydrorhamnose 3,5-epimerase
MKIISVTPLAIAGIKIIEFAHFSDARGFFTEPYRKSDLSLHPDLKDLSEVQIVQINESFSKKGVCRGLHFQWNPFMGKLVRTVSGRMIDLVLDIRKNSPTLGKLVAYDMPADPSAASNKWIWVPPGFAHGNFFPEDSKIEYLCSGEYNQECEAGISPLTKDIDWSLCDPKLKKLFDETVVTSGILSEKDRNGLGLNEWLKDKRSENFV